MNHLVAAAPVIGTDVGLRLLIFWLLAGGIAGWLASLVARTGDRMGCLMNIAVGILGAIIGGWVFHNLGVGLPQGDPFVVTTLVAFVGATILLLLLRLLAHLARRY
ncbi:MAG: GlsB/YeaQ/YmgE family stress response membrane protein [Actinomycetota bacterium]